MASRAAGVQLWRSVGGGRVEDGGAGLGGEKERGGGAVHADGERKAYNYLRGIS